MRDLLIKAARITGLILLRLVQLVVIVVVFVLSTVTGLILHLDTEAGRAVLSQAVTQLVSQGIPGTLAVESIEHIHLDRIEGVAGRVLAPDGEEVIVAEGIGAHYDLVEVVQSLWERRVLPIDRAHVSRAWVSLRGPDWEHLDLARAFDEVDAPPEPTDKSTLVVDLEHITVEHVDVTGSPATFPADASLSDLEGSVLIDEPVVVDVRHALVTTSGMPRDAEVHGLATLALEVGREATSLDAGYAGLVGPVPVTVDGSLVDGETIDVELLAGPVQGEAIAAMVPELEPRGPLRLALSAQGSVDDVEVTLDAALGQGGQVKADARARAEDGGYRVTGDLDFDRIDLSALLPQGPPSRLNGQATVAATFADTLRARADVTTAPSQLDGTPLPPLAIAARYADEQLAIDAQVDEPGLRASVDAVVDLTDPISARATIDLEDVQLSRIPMIDAEGRVQGSVSGDLELGNGSARLNARADLVARGLRVAKSGARRLDVEGTVKGPLDQLRVDLRGQARGLAIEDRQRFAQANVSAEGSLDGGLNLWARASGGEGLVDSAEATTELRLTDGTPRLFDPRVTAERHGQRLEVSAERVDLGDRTQVQQLEVTGPGLDVSGNVRQGPGRSWTIELQAPQIDLRRLATLLPPVEGLDLAGTASIDADLRIGPRRLDGTLDVTAEEVSLFGVTGISGRLGLEAEPGVIDLDLQASGGPIDQLAVEADDLRHRGSPFELSSYLRATGELRTDLRVDLGRAPQWLEGLGVALPALPQLEGMLDTQLTVSRAPGEAAPSVTLEAGLEDGAVAPRGQFARAIDGAVWPRQLVLRDVSLALEAGVGPGAETFDLDLQLMDRHGPLLRIDGDLEIPYRQLWQGVVMGRPMAGISEDWWSKAPLRLWAEIPRRGIGQTPWVREQGAADGDFRVVIDAEGTLADPRAALRLRSFGLAMANSPLDHPLDLVVIADLDAEHTEARVKLFAPNRQLLIAHGHYQGALLDHALGLDPQAAKRWTANAHAQICELDLSTLTPLQTFRTEGVASGTIVLKGVNTDHPVFDADLAVDELRVGEASYRSIHVDLEADRQRAEAVVDIRQRKGGLELRGETPLRWRDGMPTLGNMQQARAQLKAERFDMRGLLPFFEDSIEDLAGRLDGTLEAGVAADGGTRPVLTGQLALDDGRLQLATFGTRLSGIKARIRAEKDGTLRLDELRAEGQGGHIEASGKAHFDGLSLSKATLDFRVPEDDPIPVVLNGQSFGRASVEGQLLSRFTDQGVLRTDIDIAKLQVELPRVLGRELTELEEAEHVRYGTYDDGVFVPLQLSPEQQPSDGSAMPMVFDIDVADAEIRRQGLVIWLRGNPKIRIENGTQIAGIIHVVGGRLDVQGRQFDLEKGTIEFTGHPPDNPVVQVTASWPAPDGTKVIAEYVGPVKTGQVNLRSEPPRPKSELLALLLFGDANHQLGSGESNTESQAVGLGGSVLASGLNEALDDLIDLDLAASVDTTSSSNPEAELEWRVARSFSLSLSRVLGIPQPGESPDQTYAGIEWQFAHEWSLQTTVGDQGSTSVDVQWTHNY